MAPLIGCAVQNDVAEDLNGSLHVGQAIFVSRMALWLHVSNPSETIWYNVLTFCHWGMNGSPCSMTRSDAQARSHSTVDASSSAAEKGTITIATKSGGEATSGNHRVLDLCRRTRGWRA